jgi:hypothetical protein
MKAQYPDFEELRVGDFSGFSPYAFLHDQLTLWLPSAEQKKEAIEALPYLKQDNFTEIRKDNRNNTSYTFVRRPDYYIIFNEGKILTPQQRYGIGLIWHPELGTIFQSQSNSTVAAWGTKIATDTVYEAKGIYAEFFNDGVKINLANGKNEVSGNLKLAYVIGKGKKEIQFLKDKIIVTINHPGKFTEVLPFLLSKDAALTFDENLITYKSGETSAIIQIKGIKVKTKRLEDFNPRFGIKNCNVIEITSSGKLEYEIEF